ncbi:hypothetical protein ASF61_17960 [Duganella sp. Leaf126]|uniref:hypothetical protein n=1 Tax=Duganella sp. Leaf126 TaxID=1736266 RepID=UPI000701F7AE|nr:hypothetical protein [Duganella sp. Leaf126]KQQ31104.1 hypothetical protein ASF61_17960 [Duganella sp. Leaf126]
MEPTQDSVPEDGTGASATASPLAGAARMRQALPAKGSCWYCERPLDNVRRFCDKACADAFDEEKEFTR